MRKLLPVLLASLLYSPAAEAHQPRTIGEAGHVRVQDLATSQAFYGRLPGRPALFTWNNPKAYNLYVQITVPDIRGARRDWRVEVRQVGGSWQKALPERKTWEKFWEPFGGDSYLLGGEIDTGAPPGQYRLSVDNPDHRGVYVLVIGKQENFGPGDMLAALRDIPRIKHDYYGQSWPEALATRTLPIILIWLGGLAGVIYLIRRRRRGKNQNI